MPLWWSLFCIMLAGRVGSVLGDRVVIHTCAGDLTLWLYTCVQTFDLMSHGETLQEAVVISPDLAFQKELNLGYEFIVSSAYACNFIIASSVSVKSISR